MRVERPTLEKKKGRVTNPTDRPDQRSGRPHPGCPRVPVSASTAYTLAGIGGNPRRTARGQATRRPTADCTAAGSTRPPTSASVSEHCLHTRGRWRRPKADCTGAASQSAHGGVHGGRLREAKAGEASSSKVGDKKRVQTCVAAVGHKSTNMSQVMQRKKAQRPKLDNGVHQIQTQ